MDPGHEIFERHLNATLRALDRFPSVAAVHARNFFDTSFTNKGFTDNAIELWKPVMKKGSPKERPLVQSGRLRRSLATSPGLVYTDVEYAAIHNEGGGVSATQTVREHTRKGRKVRSHLRKVHFTMPKRQFMGPSAKLDKELEQIAVDLISTALNAQS